MILTVPTTHRFDKSGESDATYHGRAPMAGLSPDESLFMRSFKIAQDSCSAASILIAEGDPHGKLYTVYSGWAHRFKVLSDGRRQILDILLPGDFIGLDSILASEFSYSVEAITTLTYDVYNAARLSELYATQPGLGLRLLRIAAVERQRLETHLTSIGPRSADERMAAFLLTCHARLRARGLVDGNTFPLPLTQQHMADYLGITLVHTNRVLRRLQERDLVALKHREVTIRNMDELKMLALADDQPAGTLPV
jgi:CRP-like cAMP-binding protein